MISRGEKIGNPLIFSHTYNTCSINTYVCRQNGRSSTALQSFTHFKDQEILDNVFKNCTKPFTQTSCRRVDMGANVKIFSLDENPEGKGCFHWYQISGNLKIFGCSSANAAIEVVILFEISSSINRKKNYVNNSWSANTGLLEEVGLLRSCSVHYTHQQKKTYTQVQYQKKK